MVDGWACGSEHYIGVLYETSQGSREQSGKYGKSLENVVALIADDSETYKALSELCEVPMIGCYSYRLALAVRDYLKPNDHLICKINTMMGKLKYPKLGWTTPPIHQLETTAILSNKMVE